jgi:hypothetical protein
MLRAILDITGACSQAIVDGVSGLGHRITTPDGPSGGLADLANWGML